MTLERYAAVIYPIWYKTNVRTVELYNVIFKFWGLEYTSNPTSFLESCNP